MRRRLSRSWLIVGIAATGALFLTVTRPSPEGLISFGMGDRVVRAAPGQRTAVAKRHNLTSLEVVNNTLIKIRDTYVDPSRIDPKEMLYAALDSVQLNIPEVLVETDRERDELTIQVNDKRETFSTADIDSPWRLSKKLKQIFRFMERHMNPGADLAEVEYAAVNGMLGTLDPHSVILDPEQSREMEVNTGGEFGGLGIVIGMRNKKLTIIRPMPDTPAMEAGVRSKDHIVRIDDEVTENLTLSEAVDRMRGEEGSKVTLWIRRDGEEQLLPFEITRARIKVQSVKHKLLSKNVGYIKIDQFAGKTDEEVESAVRRLKKSGAKAFVLDLRWNPGGLLEQAIEVSDLFVNRGTIVTTVGGQEREPRRASRKSTITEAPLVVLVNSNSASASEILAGALKNLDRALVVGSTTFGKGSVQILYDNKDGSKLKLTIAQYLTPGDLSIQGLGIAPDIALNRMYVSDENEDPGDIIRLLPPRHRYREADLKSSLNSKYAVQQSKPKVQLSFLYEPPKSDDTEDDDDLSPLEASEAEPEDDEIVEDFEIRLARDLLVSAGSPTRSQFLKRLSRLIDKRRAAEISKLTNKLASLGVDWSSASSNPGKTSLRGSFEIVGRTVATGGEAVELLGKVTNTGDKTAYRVQARAKSEDPIFDGTEQVFGKIEPGETKEWISHLRIPATVSDRVSHISFQLRDQARSATQAQALKLRIEAAKKPVFSYAHQLIDDSNGDGLVQPGETYRLRVTVKNTGVGTATDTTAILRNKSGDDLLLTKARFEIGELKPGAEKQVYFAFKTDPHPRQDVAVVEMNVYDGKLGQGVTDKLKYPVRSASAGPKSASGSVVIRTGSATIHEGASDDAGVVSDARKGTELKVTGRLGDWFRVQLADSRPGFVHKSHVRKGGGGERLAGAKTRWQVTPPEISVAVPSYETAAKSFQLKGKATDDTHIEDVFIFVSNREAKIEDRKIFYRSNRGGDKGDELAFAADIPLWPGSNTITVVARENNDVAARHTLHLYRDAAKSASKASSASASP